MNSYNLRKFVDFNALEINCQECKCVSSLENPKCVECINKLDLKFDMLELVKRFSKIYFERGLSESLLNNSFHIFNPVIVPSFLNFYILPVKGKNIGSLGKFNVINTGNIFPTFSLKPTEYSLNFEEIELLNSLVKKIQSEELSLKNIDKIIPKGKEFLKPLVLRYTVGLGIIEEFLSCKNIQDVYINSPGNGCLFSYDANFGNASSNIYLKNEMINKIGTFLRTNSGRPFDEAFPVIHSNLGKMNARICGISEPLSFNGTGFAIRKHALNPITLNHMVFNEFLSADVAGLLWFLVDSEISVLVTGARGSGKTSLLGSLLFEIPLQNRLIIIEDTRELPLYNLRRLGYNIEHLRTTSFDASESFEFLAETALRTALRLGESVLVIGEVRGSEAKTLFEAMRVGAAGSSVFGTIHGSDAFDTFDRLVNDLNVPATSFKACDVVVSCANLRFGDTNKWVRKLISVTEIGKLWDNNPQKENGFTDLINFDSSSKKYKFSKLKDSVLLKKIAYNRGVSITKVINNIKLRSKIKSFISKLAKNNPNVLSPEATIEQNKEFLRLVSLHNYNTVFDKFKSFIQNSEEFNGFSAQHDIIVKALYLLRANSSKTAVTSSSILKSLDTRMSRSRFNNRLSKLESDNIIKCNKNREWFLPRKVTRVLKKK